MDLSNLRDICDLFSPDKVRDASRRDLLARAIESNNYIRKLIDLFHICEDLESADSLHQLYEIVRSIFYLNKSSIFEVLFSEEFILDIIGCLEYDPQLTFPEKRNHRDFLDTKATFKEVIPIGNQDLLAKIHQTYRVQYIQDAILPAPSLFEENLLSTMNSFLFFNKVDIVTLLYVSEDRCGEEKDSFRFFQEDPKFLRQLFSTLKDEKLPDDKRKDLMLFLKEFCVFSQTLQQQNRDNFFQVSEEWLAALAKSTEVALTLTGVFESADGVILEGCTVHLLSARDETTKLLISLCVWVVLHWMTWTIFRRWLRMAFSMWFKWCS